LTKLEDGNSPDQRQQEQTDEPPGPPDPEDRIPTRLLDIAGSEPGLS